MQGFGAPELLETPRASIGVYRKIVAGDENVYRAGDGGFCAATGTPIYRKQTGAAALRALLDDHRAGGISRGALYGSYCIILFDGSRLQLFTDPIGTYHAWRDAGSGIIASSFVAIAETAGRLTVDTQSVYEYVFQGATYGGDTAFSEIKLVSNAEMLEIGGVVTAGANGPPVAAESTDGTLDEHLARSLANLRGYYEAIAASFGDKIDTALSGGYDSRLTLALLLEQGRMPKIHVYGAPDDDDVVVAKRIAAGEGFALTHSDKRGAARFDLDAFGELVERNFYGFNGYPDDGLFENGTDMETRRARCAGGELMLNGGGGEVFRNFFYLPDRALTADQFLWSFYSRFDPKACTGLFSEVGYHRALGEKVAATVGNRRDQKLSRQQIEMLYPMFRCRFWMGRNNSVNNRLGPALTPFIDANIVPAALAIPMKWKNTGLFEGRLIRAVSPTLAGYPSSYGHGFDVDPPLKRRLQELAVFARPPILRRYTYRLKTRGPSPRPYWLTEDYLGRAIDTSFPYMRRYFDTAKIYEDRPFNRLCSLEYMFQRLQPVNTGDS